MSYWYGERCGTVTEYADRTAKSMYLDVSYYTWMYHMLYLDIPDVVESNNVNAMYMYIACLLSM